MSATLTPNIAGYKENHSLAPSILLDRALTLTTLFCIALDPISRLTIVSTFLQPHLRNVANDGPVVPIDRTPKAELVRRRCSARYGWDYSCQRGLGSC